MSRLRAVVGTALRRPADRIDHAGAPKAIGWSFTFERGVGIRFREDRHGCPLWYLGDDSYARAHAEADTEHPVVDWAAAAGRRPGRNVVTYQGGRRVR